MSHAPPSTLHTAPPASKVQSVKQKPRAMRVQPKLKRWSITDQKQKQKVYEGTKVSSTTEEQRYNTTLYSKSDSSESGSSSPSPLPRKPSDSTESGSHAMNGRLV